MGLVCDVKQHIERLTVFFNCCILYLPYGLFGAILLRLFFIPNFLHLDWHNLLYTISTMPQQLGTDYIGCVTLLVIIGKSICPSCQKEGDHLEYYCTSEIYRGISLLSASTVDSINGFYIVYIFCRVESRHAAPLASEDGFCPGMNPRKWKSFREHRCVSMHLTNKTCKQGKNICTFMCFYQIFAHQFNLVTFTRQHGGYKLYHSKLRCHFKRLLLDYSITELKWFLMSKANHILS